MPPTTTQGGHVHTNQPNTPTTLATWALAGALTAAALFGIGAAIHTAVNDDADPAACKAAMREDFYEAMRESAEATVGGPGESSRPPECEGVDDATVRRLAEEILAETLND